MRYPNNLPPGLYLSNGVKSVSLGDMTEADALRLFGSDGRTQTADQLFASVAWIYACWVARADAIAGLPRRIVDERGNEVTEDKLPFKINLGDLLYRTEISLQARAAAYWLVESNRARSKTAVRWADPHYIQPEYDYTTAGRGLLGFRRSVGLMPFIPVDPATLFSDKLVYLWLPGMAEIGPGVPPSMPQHIPGEVLRNIDRFADLFFDQGGMPIVLISVPQQTDLKEVERVEGRFNRVMARIENAFKPIAMRSDVKVTPLGAPPADLAMPELSGGKQKDILVANRTPISVVMGEAANKAEAEQQKRNWLEDTISPRATRIIAPTLNDQLFSRFGLTLIFEITRHPAFRKDVGQTATAFKTLRDGGLGVRAAAFFAGIEVEELPQGTPLVDEPPAAATQPNPAGPAPAPKEEPVVEGETEEEEEMAAKAADLGRWKAKVVKRWGKVQPAAVPFESDNLTTDEMAAVRLLLAGVNSKEEVAAVFAKAAAGFRPTGLKAQLDPIPDLDGEWETARPVGQFDEVFPDLAGLLEANAV